jgi:hypothetical protein
MKVKNFRKNILKVLLETLGYWTKKNPNCLGF